MSTRKHYLDLIDEIQKHDRLYFTENRPSVSDLHYDKLKKELEAIEKEHPDWILPSSPTQRIGETLTKGFRQLEHSVPMLSLDNTYSQEELEDFIKRVHKLSEKKEVPFCAELKMDGVAVTARYEKGIFVRALTRGDGRKGDDITGNMKTILSVPLKLATAHPPEVLEVRGEVYMTHKVFQTLNSKKEAMGEEPWANPRNAAAGSLKQIDPKEVAKRKLSAVFYGIAEDSSDSVSTQFECHHFLRKLGLPTFNDHFIKRCKDIEEIMKFADKVQKTRDDLDFDIDGMVLKVDAIDLWDELGVTGRSPRWAVAYKFAPEQATTRIHEITVQVGRTGVLTPVAELEPVLLAGSTISRATLHNQEEVERKDIRVHDTVVIEKGGDVIPKVVEVVLKKRPKDSHSWKMPKKCPVCGTTVVHREGEVAVRCPNSKGCPAQVMRKIAFFASKHGMDIDHMGEKVVEQLVENEFVKNISDIYALTEKELSELEGFKEKSIQNLLESIDASRHCTLARFICALGIKYVGEETAEALAHKIKDIHELEEMTEEELKEIEGVGDKVAEAIVDYFTDAANRKEIDLLLKRGVTPKAERQVKHKGHDFAGKTFVLTGTLENYSRDEASKLIKERGGKVSGSVSSQTDYVLVGESPGSKLDKARALKIKTLTEKEFKGML